MTRPTGSGSSRPAGSTSGREGPRPPVTMRRAPSPPARAARAGFTFVEVMIAIAVAGILAMMAGPRIGAVRDRLSVRSARQVLTAVIDAARSAATQRGRSARVLVGGDSAVAVVDTAAGEHHRPGGKLHLGVPAHKEDRDAARFVANQHHGRGRPCDQRGFVGWRHSGLRWAARVRIRRAK